MEVFSAKISFEVRGLGLDLDIETSKNVIGIVGASGGGKSTLLRILAGLEPNYSGCIMLRGSKINTSQRSWRQKTSWLPQDSTLIPHMNVMQNINLPTNNLENWETLANQLHISHLQDRLPNRLSGGEKQRVALARSLNQMSNVMLLDEPFSALDQKNINAAANAIKDYQKKHQPFTVLVTHDMIRGSDLVEEWWHLENSRLKRI